MPELLSSPSLKSPRMLVVNDIAAVREQVSKARQNGARIGCVPTMGALHEGHLSLIRQARQDCDLVVVTIFVNPTQFGPNEDYKKYPRPAEADLASCRGAGVDLVFHPETETIYPPNFSTFVEVEQLTNVLEGAFRPGHFRGVATVVLKLLNITAPDVAYFGQKDYQQQLVIRKLCHDLHVPVEIQTLPTIRNADGLAISSRNAYLTPQQRQSALALSRALNAAKQRVLEGNEDMALVAKKMQKEISATEGVRLDYAVIAEGQTLRELPKPADHMVALTAAYVGETRLIDNIVISSPEVDVK